MIEVKIKNGGTHISIEGSVLTLAADVICIIQSVYCAIREDDASMSEAYKALIIGKIEDKDLVWAEVTPDEAHLC